MRFIRSKKVQDRQLRPIPRNSECPSFGGLRVPRELHGARDALAFLHVHQLIRLNVFHRVDLPAGPVDFEHVDFLHFPQAEVNPEVILRNVTAATAYLVNLPMRLSFSWHARYTNEACPNSAAI